MSIDVKQSVLASDNKVTNVSNEIRTKVTDSSFRIIETCNPNDRNYELRHWRESAIRWQHDGSIVIDATNKEFAPNTGYLHMRSTGSAYLVSKHNVIISAQGRKKTGGGEGGSDDEKSLELFASGDMHIQSDGKGGVYITSAKNIEFKCPGDMIFSAGGQISMNTGAKDPLSLGLSKGIGSGKFVISTGSYELSTADYKETVTGAKNIENHGEINQQQKIAVSEPTLPQQHITTTETVGSLVHKVGYDYVLEVDGKMLLKVNNNPAKKVGGVLGGPGAAMGYATQTTEAFKQEIYGTRATYIRPDTTLSYGADTTTIDVGYSNTEITKASPKNTAFSVTSKTSGDIILKTTAQGNIAVDAGPTPSNFISVKNAGGSIRVEANGAMGMIQMLATKEIRGTAIKINLN